MFREIVLVVIMTASITLNLYLVVTDPWLSPPASEIVEDDVAGSGGDNGDIGDCLGIMLKRATRAG